MAYDDTGGIPVVPGATLTSMPTFAGQVRFGDTLFGTDTKAGLRQLIGWRDLPDVEVGDSPRPQAHGTYPGSAYGDSLTVTGVFLLRGRPEAKALALEAIERATRLDGLERPLIVNDSTGASFRMARVIARNIPQDRHFTHAPVEFDVQWRCADPRRYALEEAVTTLRLATSVGGLEYPLEYPLDYGVTIGNATTAANPGTSASPVLLTFHGPLANPRVTCTAGWSVQFDTSLMAGETLVVNSADGTVKLGGEADRLFTISPTSSPLEDCTLPPGEQVTLHLTAAAGDGTASLATRPAYL